jgi:serine/threonine-protein kinase RsbW
MSDRPHILVVEDEPLVLDALQATLEETYHVTSARTVKEAQTVLQTAHIDVALVDHILPDGRGDDVAVLAEKTGAAVIKMTGYSEESLGLVASGRPHLLKPFALQMLLSTVEYALEHHQ